MGQKKYDGHYSDSGFKQKVHSFPSSAGSKVLRQAMILYVLLKDKDVPNWIKVSIIGVLGYFIFPFDLIPDFLLGGYLDDLALMAGLVGQLRVYTTSEILSQVDELMPEWAKRKAVST